MTENQNNNAADAPAAASNDKEVGEMKRGDYMIHVYVQSGKQFKSHNDTISPMIEINCCGKKKYSSSKTDVASG